MTTQAYPVGHDIQQAVQVADQGLHRGLWVLHREAGEGPATVIEGEVSALGGEAEPHEGESLLQGSRTQDTSIVRGQKALS